METKLLLETKFGSVVYGTSLPTSDIDVGRVCLEPENEVFGLSQPQIVEQQINKDDNTDTRLVFLKRFLRLCIKGNPNVLEWLYTPKEFITYQSEYLDEIFKNKHLFLDIKSIISSHFGFAKSQVIKMKRHEKTIGEKRRELCRKFGYDTKFASHAIRLCYQLDDILDTNSIVLPYPKDRCELLKYIKLGNLSLEEFERMYSDIVKKLDKKIENLSIISSVDYNRITKILKKIYESEFFRQD